MTCTVCAHMHPIQSTNDFSARDVVCVVCVGNIYIYICQLPTGDTCSCKLGDVKARETFAPKSPHKEQTRCTERYWTVLARCMTQPYTILPDFKVWGRLQRAGCYSCEQLGCHFSTDVAGWSPTKDVEHEAKIAASMAPVFDDPMMHMATFITAWVCAHWRVARPRRKVLHHVS